MNEQWPLVGQSPLAKDKRRFLHVPMTREQSEQPAVARVREVGYHADHSQQMRRSVGVRRGHISRNSDYRLASVVEWRGECCRQRRYVQLIHSESARQKLELRVGSERRARHDCGRDAAEEIVAENRRQIERNPGYG